MTHVILYMCLILSSVTLASLAVLLAKQIIEYRRTDAYLQTRREEIRRMRLHRTRQLEIWRKSCQSAKKERKRDK